MCSSIYLWNTKAHSSICDGETHIINVGVDCGSVCDDDLYCVVSQEELGVFALSFYQVDSGENIQARLDDESSGGEQEKSCEDVELDITDRNNEDNEHSQTRMDEKCSSSDTDKTEDDDHDANIDKSGKGENLSQGKRKFGLESVYWFPELHLDLTGLDEEKSQNPQPKMFITVDQGESNEFSLLMSITWIIYLYTLLQCA